MTALDQPCNIAAVIGRSAHAHPDRPAIIAADITLSYEKLWMIGKAFAVNMLGQGIGPGTTVSLYSRDMIASVGVMIATALVGARFRLFSEDDGAGEEGRVVLYSPEQEPPCDGAVLISADWSPRNTPLPDERDLDFPGYADPEAPWWAMQTSGTTGRPKLLWLSQRIALDRSLAVGHDFRGEETRFCSLFGCATRPFYVRAMAALIHGSTIVDSIDPGFLAHHGVTLFSGSPRLAADWIRQQKPKLRFATIQVSGAPVRGDLVPFLLGTFDAVEDVYGSGETNKAFVTRYWREGGTLHSQGVRQDSVVEILTAEGTPVAPGEIGDVRIRNPYMAPGYDGNPEATARAFRDGWFYPGDLATWSGTGGLDVLGRADQLINLGGVKIDPLEIEAALDAIPAVRQSAVFLDPRSQMPPRTMAFLQLEPGADPADTAGIAVKLCEDRFGGVRGPGSFYVVPHVPVTHDGVPRRAECARLARDLPLITG